MCLTAWAWGHCSAGPVYEADHKLIILLSTILNLDSLRHKGIRGGKIVKTSACAQSLIGSLHRGIPCPCPAYASVLLC